MKFILILFLISFQFLNSFASSNLLYSLTSFDEISGKQILNIINPNVNVYSPGINLDIQYQIISTHKVDSDTMNILCSSEQIFYLLAYKITENKIIEIGSIKSNNEINLPNQQVLIVNKIAYIINNSYANQVIHVTILNFMDYTSKDVFIQAYAYVKGTPVVTGVSQYLELMYLAYTGSDNSINALSFNISLNEKTPNETVYEYYGIGETSSNQISMIFNGNDNWGDVYLVLVNDDGSFTGCKISEHGFGYICKQEFKQQVYFGQPKLYNPLFLSSDYKSLVFLCQNENIPTAIKLNVLSINNKFSLSSYTISNLWPDFQSPINVVFAY
ncbi:hypothetical protein ACTFIZ_005761 [Dictyostelium cf. discoideum]